MIKSKGLRSCLEVEFLKLWNIVGGGCKEGKEGNALFKPLSMVVQSAW